MTLSFDHAIILVRDLDSAIADYQTLGFTVFYGGQHAGGKTHNALIVFQDGTYLELLAPTSPALLDSIDPDDRSNFLFLFAQGEGFGGFALQSDDLAGDVAAMQARGVEVQLSPPNGCTRADGVELRWQSAMLPNTMTPFFIEDLTPRKLRVPDDVDKVTHANGAVRTLALRVAAENLDDGIQYYENILGCPPYPLNPNNDPETPTYATFDMSNHGLIIDSKPNAARPFRLNLLSPKIREVDEHLDPQLTHNAPITLQLF